MLNICSESVLLTAATKNEEVGLFAQFGGQGYAGYFDELKQSFRNHSRMISPLVEAAEDTLKTQLQSQQAKSFGYYYKNGMNVREWMDDDDKTPSREYLSSAHFLSTYLPNTTLPLFDCRKAFIGR